MLAQFTRKIHFDNEFCEGPDTLTFSATEDDLAEWQQLAARLVHDDLYAFERWDARPEFFEDDIGEDGEDVVRPSEFRPECVRLVVYADGVCFTGYERHKTNSSWSSERVKFEALQEAFEGAKPKDTHETYKTGDSDAPNSIKDRNGEGKTRPSPMTDAEYLRHSGTRCPFCQSTDLFGGSVDAGAGTARQEILCRECESEWINHYTLTRIEREA